MSDTLKKRRKLPDALPFGVFTREIEIITAVDFRKSPGDVLMQAQLGKTFVITKQGTPVAVLQQLPGETLVLQISRDGKVTYGR